MGATNCPETPRQRMIAMMYLVYTAMLALNVSSDILNAFIVVDDTLIVSNKNVASKCSNDYLWLNNQEALLGAAKVGDVNKKARQLKEETNSMVNYIETMRRDLIYYVDGDSLTTIKNDKGESVTTLRTVATMKAKENFDKPTDFMINKKKATELKNRINLYKKNVLKLIAPKDKKQIEKYLGLKVDQKFTKDNFDQSWEEHNFEHIIAAASVTILNKTIGEVRNAESMILDHLKSSISADDFKFDQIGGRTIPKSQMVFSGDNYEADIIVAAYDTKTNPEVYYKMGVDTLTEENLAGAVKLEGAEGVVKLKIGANNIGAQRYAGLIKIIDPQGRPKYYSFRDEYSVMKPTATIAADKMNVLYAGIANPVSVAAPVAPEKLSVSFPGCKAKSTGAGKYDISVPASLIGKKVTATVSAKVENSNKVLGSTIFRVKKVPNPRAVLGANIRGGKRAKSELLANPLIRASMGEDFAYDLKWRVNSFRVIFVIKGYEDPPLACQGGVMSEAVKAKIQKATSNTVIYFTDIKVSSEAGTRTLDEFSVRIR